MSKRVFVSHSSHDMEIAETVVEYLEASGLECWISSRDISPGSDWAETIYNAIAGSGVMILLFSGNANDSWQIRNELDIATNLRVPIVPVRFDEADISKGLRYFTNSHQWLDGVGSGRIELLDRILTAVRRVLSIPGHDNLRTEVPGPKRRTLPWVASFLGLTSALLVIFLLRGGWGGTAMEPHGGVNFVAGGTDSWDFATDIEALEDGGFFAAGTWDWGFWSKVWVAKFDSTFSLIWNWSDSLSGECRPKLLLTADGGVITAFGEYADFDHSGYWVRALRLDSLGGCRWDSRLRIEWPGAIQPVYGSLELSEDSTVYAAFTMRSLSTRPCYATHLAMVDAAEGSITWDTIPDRQECTAYLPLPVGGAFHVYKDIPSSANGIELLSPSGEVQINAIVGDRLSEATCAALTPDGGLITALTKDRYGAGNGDLLVMRFSSELELVWESSFGGEMWESVSEILTLPGEGFVLAGRTQSFGDGSSDGWVLKLTEDGDLVWQMVMDLGGSESLEALAADREGCLLVAGSTTMFGQPDAWLARIGPNGGWTDSVRLGVDILSEDWQQGFLDQSVWLMGRNRNYTAVLHHDTASGDFAVDLNGVPLVSRLAYPIQPGLCLAADVTIPDRPSANGINWVAVGLTGEDVTSFHEDPVAVTDRQIRWDYTEGTSGQECGISIICVSGDTLIMRDGPDEGLLQPDEPQRLCIETCPGSVRFWTGESLFIEVPVLISTGPDSLRVYLWGSSGSLPHLLDDVRLFLRRW